MAIPTEVIERQIDPLTVDGHIALALVRSPDGHMSVTVRSRTPMDYEILMGMLHRALTRVSHVIENPSNTMAIEKGPGDKPPDPSTVS
jgi:hypothetical protein